MLGVVQPQFMLVPLPGLVVVPLPLLSYQVPLKSTVQPSSIWAVKATLLVVGEMYISPV